MGTRSDRARSEGRPASKRSATSPAGPGQSHATAAAETTAPENPIRARLASEIKELVAEGMDLANHLTPKGDASQFSARYQGWYTAARLAIARLAPERLDEFVELYKPKKDPTRLDFTNYGIYYYLIGVSWGANTDPKGTTLNRFYQQLIIVQSTERRLDSIFANLRELLQAELFASELDAARDLRRNGHIRAAGGVVGFVIERHLAEVCSSHHVSIAKRDPHISDFNDRLREEGVIPVATWRRVQWMGDIRNLCVHKKEREPEPDEVDRLIDEANWLVKNLT